MKFVWLGLALCGGILAAGTQDSEFNVNTRYTVEAVVVSGEGWTANFVSAGDSDRNISVSLGREIAGLIGERLNPTIVDDLARRLRKEFHARSVEHRVLRGKSPDYVQVVFEIKLQPTRFDVSVPKAFYNSSQNWTGEVDATVTTHQNGFTVGLVSDGDELSERYTGVVARYENPRLGTGRARLRFEFENYHEQWNASTLDRLSAAPPDTAGVYRTRQNFAPEVTFVLARPLTLSVGTSFERFQDQSPSAQVEAANSITAALRYHRRLEGDDDQQDLDGAYNLRAATRLLASDFAYARHRWEFRYMLTRGKSVLIDDATAGLITGRAPLFERFVLGNSSTLRGWNKYDLDPLGGNRMLHNTVDYRYGLFEVFYDSGAIWERSEPAVLRHSLGVGLRQGVFSLAVAFPVKDGHVDPIFMVGMNY